MIPPEAEAFAKASSYDDWAKQNPTANGQDNTPAPPKFSRIINPADWENVPIPARYWTVPDYIPAGVVTMLSGDGGLGKSLLALQLAVGRALAKEWIGLLPEPGKTLYLSAEDDSDELHRRLNAVRKFYGATWSELADIRIVDLVGDDPLLAILTKGRIEPSQTYQALDNYMADFLPSLVILDVLA